MADCETVQRSRACLTCCSFIPDRFTVLCESTETGEEDGGEGSVAAGSVSTMLVETGAVFMGSSRARVMSLVMAQTK